MREEQRVLLFEERLCVYLMMLKITPNLRGYTFMKECAKKIYEDSTMKFNANTKLYYDVGNMFNEKSTSIERALRHAIEVSLKKNGIEDFERYMKLEFYNEKPSPRELLCILVEKAVIESNKMFSNEKYLYENWKETFLR